MNFNKANVFIDGRGVAWRLWFIGDVHIGNINCNLVALSDTIKQIAEDKNSYWIGMGDMGDYISYKDKRFNPTVFSKADMISELNDLSVKHTAYIAQKLEPIAKKCLGLHEGNHERVYWSSYNYNPASELAKMLAVPYLGYQSLTRVFVFAKRGVVDYTISIYCHHGFGSGRKEGSHINNLVDLMTKYDADIYALGHNHILQSVKRVSTAISGKGYPVYRERVFLNTGTYYDSVAGVDDYTSVANMPKRKVGSPCVEIQWKHSRAINLSVRL